MALAAGGIEWVVVVPRIVGGGYIGNENRRGSGIIL